MNFYSHSLNQEGKLSPNSCDWLINTWAIDAFLSLSFGCPGSAEEGRGKDTHPLRCGQLLKAVQAGHSLFFCSSQASRPGPSPQNEIAFEVSPLAPVQRAVVLRAHNYSLGSPEKEFPMRGSSLAGCYLSLAAVLLHLGTLVEMSQHLILKLCHISWGKPRFP